MSCNLPLIVQQDLPECRDGLETPSVEDENTLYGNIIIMLHILHFVPVIFVSAINHFCTSACVLNDMEREELELVSTST